MPSNQPASITEVGTVFVPVSDQDRALEFYVDRLGFEKRSDFLYGGSMRWVEVAPRGAAIGLALVSSAEGIATPTTAARCAFVTGDIDGFVTKLRQQGGEAEDVGRSGSNRLGLLSADPGRGRPS